MLKLTEVDNSKDVKIAVGEKVEITLVWNPSTGYFWQEGNSTAGVLQEVKHDEASGVPGEPTKVHFVFRIINSGVIVLLHARPWPEKEPNNKWFQIYVTV